MVDSPERSLASTAQSNRQAKRKAEPKAGRRPHDGETQRIPFDNMVTVYLTGLREGIVGT